VRGNGFFTRTLVLGHATGHGCPSVSLVRARCRLIGARGSLLPPSPGSRCSDRWAFFVSLSRCARPRRHEASLSFSLLTSSLQPPASSLALALALTLLTGCVGTPRYDEYAATWPEEVPADTAANGSIYQVGHDVALFENTVAHRVGDTLTITLAESTAASKSSKTSTKKSTSVDLPGPTIAGRPVTVNGTEVLQMGVENEAEFDGEGASSQTNKLQGNLTVTVAKRLANGNLLVRGQKWIQINQGREYVRVQGIVRPIDIDPDNTIPSYKVADAMIAYGAQGALADANSPGLLSRFFNLPWLPF
jgi:flagellar L-ring protein FlgH